MSVPLRIARLVLRHELPIEALRPYVDPPQRATPAAGQLSLWIRDADGTPERPWTITPETRFDCVALSCRGMKVSVCVARQIASGAQRTRDTWRGQGSEFPTCVTERCAQGRAIREATSGWLERRPEPFLGNRRSPAVQRALNETRARRRLERVGLLGDVPTIDDLDREPASHDGT